MGFLRAFISVDIPENILKEIEKIQKKLPAFEGKIT
jgi:2'-5' RNA ligase